MTITEFHALAAAALAAEPDEAVLIELAKEAQQLSDMVSWADGIIDKDERVSEAFFWLQKQALSGHPRKPGISGRQAGHGWRRGCRCRQAGRN